MNVKISHFSVNRSPSLRHAGYKKTGHTDAVFHENPSYHNFACFRHVPSWSGLTSISEILTCAHLPTYSVADNLTVTNPDDLAETHTYREQEASETLSDC